MQQERLESQQVYFFSTEVVHSNMMGGMKGGGGSGLAGGLPCQLCPKPPVLLGIALSLLCLSTSAPPQPRQNDALRADGKCELPGEGTSERVEGQRGSAMKAASPKIKSKRKREKSSIRRLRVQKKKRVEGKRRRASPVTACQKIVDMQAMLQSRERKAKCGAFPAI